MRVKLFTNGNALVVPEFMGGPLVMLATEAMIHHQFPARVAGMEGKSPGKTPQ